MQVNEFCAMDYSIFQKAYTVRQFAKERCYGWTNVVFLFQLQEEVINR